MNGVPEPAPGLRFVDPRWPDLPWVVAQWRQGETIYVRRQHDGRLFHYTLDSWRQHWFEKTLVAEPPRTLGDHASPA